MTSHIHSHIDFINAFSSIDHARLLAIMEDLDFPQVTIEIICDIYANSTTSFHNSCFAPPLKKGTIQRGTLSPYLYIIFLEPLLRWMKIGSLGYHFNTS